MSTEDDRIDDLLDRWEDELEQGRDLSADELCQTCPELASVIEPKLKQLRRMAGVLRADEETAYSERQGIMPPVESLDVQARFVLTDFIDDGGLGSVFGANDDLLKRAAAIKFLQRPHARSAERVKQFKTECEITSRLDHPGIVPIYGHGVLENGQPFYVMQRISGKTLKECADDLHQQLTNVVPNSEQRVQLHSLLSTFVSVCQTIHYAHCRGVIHRDIKPANIMVGKHGETTVLDWGLATPVGRDEQYQSLAEETLQVTLDGHSSDSGAGTPIYMSPEQHAGTSDVGPLSDVYSLGATLYVILTGNPPYEAKTLPELRAKVLQGKTRNPKSIYRWASSALAAICSKAMSIDPADRYVTAFELAQDVERFLADEPVRAHPESFIRRGSRWMSRHRLLTFFIATGLIGGLIGSSVYSSIVTAHAHREQSARMDASKARYQSLRLAAGFAANSVALKLNDRFRILEIVTRDDELVELLQQAEVPDDTDWQALQGLLLRFKEEYHAAAGYPDSWFLCDATGRQIARAPTSSKSIGKNYAHRDYFHGQGLARPEELQDQSHVTDVHRSKVYASSSTGTLKVALSRPVWSQEAINPDRKFLGIVGLSVSLGEFKELQTGLGDEQLVMVVDLEENVIDEKSYEGLVLHHPKMHESKEKLAPRKVEQALLTQLREIRTASATQETTVGGNPWVAELLLSGFNDPWHAVPLSNTHWIAAYAPIWIQGRSPDIADTGWGVIVAEREIDEPGFFGFELRRRGE
jgi:serine/threonine-protein kinase